MITNVVQNITHGHPYILQQVRGKIKTQNEDCPVQYTQNIGIQRTTIHPETNFYNFQHFQGEEIKGHHKCDEQTPFKNRKK